MKKESVKVKGNQVKILSDPVTVSREQYCEMPLCENMRRCGICNNLRVRKPAEKVSESLPMKAHIHGKMYE